jgi:ATP-dependent Clp protease ATP-binding subunit ClpC
MFERFSGAGREVIVFAQEEARGLRHHYIGTEHLLLGLLRQGDTSPARVLESLDVTVEEVRQQVLDIVGPGDEATTKQIPFTPRSKKVLELALRESRSLGHDSIGPEHVLLGLVDEHEGVAARILLALDAPHEKIRDEVIRMLCGPGRRPSFGAFPPRPPRRWEFRVLAWPGPSAQEELAELGAEGWELRGVVPAESGPQLIFQRPRQPDL